MIDKISFCRKNLLYFCSIISISFFVSPVIAASSATNGDLEQNFTVETVLSFIGTTIEIVGIAIMVGGMLLATWHFCKEWWYGRDFETMYKNYRTNLGQAIMLGLEVLIVADIVGTVAIEPTLANLEVLGVIILIRTFLSFALEIEIHGYFPWRKREIENSS